MASSASASAHFQSVFNAALETYEKTTKNKLLTHPLATQLQSCDSPADILLVLRDLVQQFDQSHISNERLRNWLDPTVNVLFAFSATLSEGVAMVVQSSYLIGICTLIDISQVFSPAKVVFAGIGVLLLVSIRLNSLAQVIVITSAVRRLRTPTRAMMCSLISSHESRGFSSVSSYTRRYIPPQQ